MYLANIAFPHRQTAKGSRRWNFVRGHRRIRGETRLETAQQDVSVRGTFDSGRLVLLYVLVSNAKGAAEQSTLSSPRIFLLLLGARRGRGAFLPSRPSNIYLTTRPAWWQVYHGIRLLPLCILWTVYHLLDPLPHKELYDREFSNRQRRISPVSLEGGQCAGSPWLGAPLSDKIGGLRGVSKILWLTINVCLLERLETG